MLIWWLFVIKWVLLVISLFTIKVIPPNIYSSQSWIHQTQYLTSTSFLRQSHPNSSVYNNQRLVHWVQSLSKFSSYKSSNKENSIHCYRYILNQELLSTISSSHTIYQQLSHSQQCHLTTRYKWIYTGSHSVLWIKIKYTWILTQSTLNIYKLV
jgi:hypothetical protein